MARPSLRTSLISVAGFGAADLTAAAGAADAGGPVAALTITADHIGGVIGGELGDARQSPAERGNKMRALVAKRQPTRLKRVTSQKVPGERKAVGEVAADRQRIVLSQECRQPHHFVCPWLAGGTRNGSSGLRRNINEVAGYPGRHTALEIEPETEFG